MIARSTERAPPPVARCASDCPVKRLEVAAYTVPTEAPESDGTHAWDSTSMVTVCARAGDRAGLGYSYTHPAAAGLIEDLLAPVVRGRSALSPQRAWWAMRAVLRNTPRQGLGMFAISAVDTALWDLKARLLDLPLATLLGPVRDSVPVYASGGFTSQGEGELCAQLGRWAEEGYRQVKMKVGRSSRADPQRVRAAREAIGPDVELMVDANGAYTAAQALRLAGSFADCEVAWLEEPRPADDVRGLARVRARLPAGMELAAGEYGDAEDSFARMVDAEAADVLQPDITRCGGVTGLLRISAMCGSRHIPISTHCAPALTLHTACACAEVRHIEHFADHVRVEEALLDGARPARDGAIAPDLSRPGAGLELKEPDAERYRVA